MAGVLARRAAEGAQLARMEADLEQQRSALAEVRAEAERELNALSARLARVQAESNRLNALGDRLTRIGQLEDGEFDFSEPAGIGGGEPEEADGDAGQAAGDAPGLLHELDALERQLELQGQQLGLLESLLFDRELANRQLPSQMPLPSGYMISGYGGRRDPFGQGWRQHGGVDFDGATGAPILSVADGVVSFSGWRNGYGNVVEVDHGNGLRTIYAHNQRNEVQVGDLVRTGQQIARVGSTGRSTGSHLHFEVHQDGRRTNPMAFLRDIGHRRPVADTAIAQRQAAPDARAAQPPATEHADARPVSPRAPPRG
jgi:murein DD-endopeptidase MepM/ murein hydrolase activator NlpD